MLGVNIPMRVPNRHIYGNDDTHLYTRGKVVTTRWPDSSETPAGADLVFPRAR